MFDRFRIFAAYLLAIPLALILGFLTAAPGQMTFVLISMLLFFLTFPLLIKWHHALLIIFWNSAFSAFFLPGAPTFWLILALISFTLSALDYVMGRRPFLPVPEMRWALFFFSLVVVATAVYRGHFGLKIMGGSANGGKNYIYVFGAIIGYFAFTAKVVPLAKARRFAALYFASGITYVLSNLAYTMGPAFYFAYNLVPSLMAQDQAASDFGMASVNRIQGLAPACEAAICGLLAWYGIRGLLDWTRPWRFVAFAVTMAIGMLAGFRSMFALLGLIFAFQFYLEGLFRTRLFPFALALGACLMACLLFFSTHMPLAAQRALSFLPIKVDNSVAADAAGSTDWRLQIWSTVWKDVPRYLWIGKGYAIDPIEMYMTTEAIHMGLLNTYEEAMLAGDYHNGPLSVLLPFGLAGLIGFLWVLWAGGRVLYLNYRFGDASLRRINTLLFSFYLANCTVFFFIFGALSSELFVFLGAVGFSVSLNGGVKRKAGIAPLSRTSTRQPYAFELK